MTLPIRSLPQPQTAVPADLAALWIAWHRTGWTGAELMEFQTLKATLTRAGVKADVKFGITESGSPWAVLSARAAAVLAAFVICTDDGYVADWTGLPGALEVEHLSDALAQLAMAVQRCGVQ